MTVVVPGAVTELLVHQHGVATTPQLLARGLTPRRIATLVRRGKLLALHRGAYALTERWQNAQPAAQHCLRLMAVQLAAPDAVGMGPTAATGWAWPVKALPQLPLVAREPGWGTRLAGANVRRAMIDVSDVANRHGLTITSKARTITDLAARSPLADALITADAALASGVQCADLVAAARGMPVNRGRTAAVRAIEVGDPAAESPLESTSRAHIIDSDLPMPLCNVVLRVERLWFRVDLLWAALGVVGEVDGRSKYDASPGPQVIWREKRRQEQIEEWTFRVARWGYPEIADSPEPMLRRITRALGDQRRLGFCWPSEVRAEVPLRPGVQPPSPVVAEVRRLQELGIPIAFIDDRGRIVRH